MFQSLKTGDFVAALYDSKAYVAKVLEIDEEDKDCKVSFMEKAQDLFRWPKREDILWLKQNSILAKIEAPQETGKSKRLFKVNPDVDSLLSVYNG